MRALKSAINYYMESEMSQMETALNLREISPVLIRSKAQGSHEETMKSLE